MINKDLLKDKKTIILITILLAIIIIRFVSTFLHKNVFIDESVTFNQLQSLAFTGHDVLNQTNYFYMDTPAGGYTTFTYFYPMISCLYIVGFGIMRGRFVQQLLTIGACFLISYASSRWASKENSRYIFWITLFVSLTLPWGFVQVNNFWDPTFTPLYFAIHFYFFTLLMKSENLSSLKTYIYSILSISFLVFLATVYPPCRIPAVVLWIVCIIWAYKENKINISHIAVIVVTSIIFALPLGVNLMNPAFNARSQSLLVFQNGNPVLEVFQLFKNFFALFNPSFLFLTGDVIRRHSLPVFGLLGTISIIPVLTLFRQKMTPLFKYLLIVILATFFSTALTNDYAPHALRSCLAWMPFAILISYGWFAFLKDKKPKIRYLTYLLAIAYFALYVTAYVLIIK